MTHREGSIMGWITNETHGEYAQTMKAIVEETTRLPRGEPTRSDVLQCWSDDYPITDAEKHAYCRRRWNHDAFFISKSLYALAERDGSYDMRMFVINKPMPPFDPQAAFMRLPWDPMDSCYGGGSLPGKSDPLFCRRKHVSERQLCSGKEATCLPGLGGKCVACGTME